MESIWQYLTRPRIANPDEARREYMTRVILVLMALIGLFAFVMISIGYKSGNFVASDVWIMLATMLIILIGWLLVQAKMLNWGAAILPVLMLLVGWYFAYFGQLGLPAGMAYALAIMLAAMLHNAWMPWLVLSIAVTLDVSVNLRIEGIPQSDIGPIIITHTAMLIGVTLLQSFSRVLLDNALKQAHQANDDAHQANELLHQEASERQNLIIELKAKNTELEQFTYTVSHDLKSPLVTIRGFLGFLEKDALAGDTERVKIDIARIVTAADKMQRLLEELLELSRIGRIVNPMQEIPFNTIVHEAIEMVQGAIEAGKVRVVVADEMPTVTVDRVRLVQAMQNLLDNAVKFMGSQTQPRIEVGILNNPPTGFPRVSLRQTIFFVRDNGIGISPEHHERIFGLFNKLDVHSNGTGIGLALVKRIITVHGGEIWVESAGSGHGTTFYFTLPVSPP